jgi:hypothetical protein
VCGVRAKRDLSSREVLCVRLGVPAAKLERQARNLLLLALLLLLVHHV